MFPVSLCEIGERAKKSQTYIPSDIEVTGLRSQPPKKIITAMTGAIT